MTGATTGIGAATATTLAAEGYAVWLTYAHDKGRALEVAQRCAGAAEPPRVSHLDLRDPEAIDSLASEVDAAWGSLQVLVNNGGVCPYRTYDEIQPDEWDEVLETNARGTFLLTRAMLGLLRAPADGGTDRSVVNLSSIAGQVGGITTGVHYAASKAAVLAITRSFARLLADDGIRVNAVSPGPVTSSITEKMTAHAREALTRNVPVGRFGTPEEVAWVVAGLASSRAGFVTGATYDVNGGLRID